METAPRSRPDATCSCVSGAAFLAALLLSAGCGGAGGSAGADAPAALPRPVAEAGGVGAESDTPGVLPAELATGRQLFEANCQRCHGSQASGTEMGPPLVHVIYEPNHHSDAAFQRAAALGVPAHHWTFGDMPPVPGVTPEQVAEITAYVRWLQRQAEIGG
jgi:mono/diheme cytochrome c family protein